MHINQWNNVAVILLINMPDVIMLLVVHVDLCHFNIGYYLRGFLTNLIDNLIIVPP